jgi:preprotein translocase, secA subunit
MFNKYKKTISKINKLRKKYSQMSDLDLKENIKKLKENYKNNKNLNKILPDVFAIVREASKRTLNMEHFDVQLMGGIVLNEGKIAESPTGSGKTLIATCPAVLNAITEKSVIIVTVNEYLAKRDSMEMGKIYNFLGLTVGCILHDMTNLEKQNEYKKDIVYVTNSELGFDYLRDNLVLKQEDKVLRPFYFCIIDEVDSVLIDDAKTPLIISGQSEKDTSLYVAADLLAKKMTRGKYENLSKLEIMSGNVNEDGDFIVLEKEKQVILTENGIKKTEDFFHIDNLSNPENADIIHHIEVALKANYIMKKNRDYIISEKDGCKQIEIVDEFTGRVMEGRRFSDGLHQAIEAKENVEIKKASNTFATITYQNFFNKFPKKSGMTGTAKTEEKEFKNTYKLPVVIIPPNVPTKRKDKKDLVFATKKDKYNEIINEIKKTHKTGQPILVGTTNIVTSELLDKMLKKEGLNANVLNAKYIEKEAEIISHAGEVGMITIATNMAGRGTDIKVTEEAKNLGGLKIIGSEKHESRRIDNQLRGRAGRQGDPGETRFYVSLEDNLIKLFANENTINTFQSINNDGQAIDSILLRKAIENAQKNIENNHYGIRDNLLQYDKINNEQRENIYNERNIIMNSEDLRPFLLEIADDVLDDIINNNDPKNVNVLTNEIFGISSDNKNKMQYKKELMGKLKNILDENEIIINNLDDIDKFENLIRTMILKTIDENWKEHLMNLEKLKESISLQSYGQKNPLIEYKISSNKLFNDMLKTIKKSICKFVFRMKIEFSENKLG